MSDLVTFALAGLVALLILQYFKWSNEDKFLGVKGPSYIPLIGNALNLWKDASNKTIYKKVLQNFNTYGDTWRLRIFGKLILFTRDVKVIEAIVNNPKFIKPYEYKLIAEPWLGNGILLSSGDHWQKLRKLMTPGFHFQILECFITIFEEQTEVLIQNLKTSRNEPINIAPFFQALSLDIISESSMGVKLNAQSDPNSKFVAVNQELLLLLPVRFWNHFYKYEFIWRLTSHYKKQKELIKYVHNFVNIIIHKRRDKILNTQEFSSNDKENIKSKPALLDILLVSELDGKPLSNDMIQDEVNTFMLAGHETTATTLGFVIYLLAKHPKVQEELYRETKEKQIFDKEEGLTIRSLNSLTLLDNVIKETLRLYPIVPGVEKQCPEDVLIDEIFIPANTIVVTSIYSSHHNANYFDNPDEFIPERWNGEVTVIDRNPYAYLPFSGGLRNCIGQRFAVLEIKCVITKLLKNFTFSLGAENFEINLKAGLSMYSENGILVKLESR